MNLNHFWSEPMGAMLDLDDVAATSPAATQQLADLRAQVAEAVKIMREVSMKNRVRYSGGEWIDPWGVNAWLARNDSQTTQSEVA